MDGEQRFCSKPFEFFEVDTEGNAWVCCQDWLDRPIGNLIGTPFMEVWNSPAAQEIRASILDGSYRFCNRQTCPALTSRSLPKVSRITDPGLREIVERQLTVLDRGPRTLNFGYDNTCNLRCKSCRLDVIALTGEKLERARVLQARILRDGLEDAESIIVTGHGDAFASPLFRGLLRELDAERFPGLSVDLMTNGLLLTPAMWESLRKAHPLIRSVSISIDAATAATYRVNRGGDFGKLLANLRFVSRLRLLLKIRFFQLSFVVQANNYREMAAFVELGRRLHCDQVLFQQLIDWGTYQPEEIAAAAVHQPTHPEHAGLLAVLDRLRTDPLVDLSNLSGLLADPG